MSIASPPPPINFNSEFIWDVPVDGALDVSPGEEGERVARVDGERAVLGLDPLPLVRGVVPDLERGDRLAEEQRPGPEVRVALAPEAADLEVLLGRVLGVLHVPEVVLAFHLVPVNVREVVLWKLESDCEEDVQRIEDLVVQRLSASASATADCQRD